MFSWSLVYSAWDTWSISSGKYVDNKHNIENSEYTLIQATILTFPEWTDKKKTT